MFQHIKPHFKHHPMCCLDKEEVTSQIKPNPIAIKWRSFSY